MKLSKASVVYQNGWPNYGWNDVLNWTADQGTAIYQNRGIEVDTDKPGATIAARAEWLEAVDKTAPHAVRILVNGAVVATSGQVTGKAGVVTASGQADLMVGDVVKLQLYSNSAQPGTIQPPKSGLFSSTPGTYLSIA